MNKADENDDGILTPEEIAAATGVPLAEVVKQTPAPAKDTEKPGDDTYLGGTKIGTGDSGTPIYEPGPTTTRPKPRPKPKPKPNTKVALDNQSAADDAMGRPTAASQRQKDADKFTASKIADYKKTGRATGFNKGGLMKKRKKKQ